MVREPAPPTEWEGGMDEVQFWMALVLTLIALWFLKQFLHGLLF